MRRALPALLLLVGMSPPGAPGAEAARDTCRLLTRQEIADIEGGRVVEEKSSRRIAGGLALSDCFYRSDPVERSVRVEVTRRAVDSAPSPRQRWKAVFNAQRDFEQEQGGERRAGEKGKPGSPRPVAGVGEEAFWVGNPVTGALYVLKGDFYLRISVGGSDEETVRIRRASDLARKALGRL